MHSGQPARPHPGAGGQLDHEAVVRVSAGPGGGHQSVNEVPDTALSDDPGCGSASVRTAVVL